MAYEVNGSVYFDVLKYNETEHYGILSGRNIEDSINEAINNSNNLIKDIDTKEGFISEIFTNKESNNKLIVSLLTTAILLLILLLI